MWNLKKHFRLYVIVLASGMAFFLAVRDGSGIALFSSILGFAFLARRISRYRNRARNRTLIPADLASAPLPPGS